MINRLTQNGQSAYGYTQPNTIGLALYDNPVGQLAYMGEKFLNCELLQSDIVAFSFTKSVNPPGSDPRAGTGPSVLTHNEILTSVSLYYLTKSFISSGFIYYQNRFATNYTKAKTDAPLLFSSFKYNILFWPAALVKQTGNLVVYKSEYQIASFVYQPLTMV